MFKLSRIGAAFLAWLLLAAPGNAAPEKRRVIREVKLEKITGNPENFLGLSPADATGRIPGLVWRDHNKTALYLPSRTLKNFRYREYPVYDLLLSVTGGKISGMQITVYTRGDAGNWKKNQFREAVDELIASFEKQFNCKRRKFSGGKLSGTRVAGYRFNGKNVTAEIIAVTGKQDDPEKLSVNFLQPGSSGVRFREAIKTVRTGSTLAGKVQHRGNEHFILVPMIDQGSKGYCVPATVGRVLLHYGSDIDQHTLARMLGSEAQGGTNLNQTIEILKDIRGKLNVDFKNKYFFDDLFYYRKRASFIRRYNRLARKDKHPKLDEHVQSMPDFEYPYFRKLRLEKPLRDFFPYVKNSINRGIPVMWSIIVFKTDKAAGGNGQKNSLHLRLITGYATDPERIIYSDSWGRGHEKKIMSRDDAMAITLRLFTLEPKQ